MNLKSYFGEFTARDGKADAGDGASDIEERAVGDDTLGIALLGPGEFARGHVLPALAGVLPTAVFAVSYGVVTRRIRSVSTASPERSWLTSEPSGRLRESKLFL
jgi:hypothetical protein